MDDPELSDDSSVLHGWIGPKLRDSASAWLMIMNSTVCKGDARIITYSSANEILEESERL